MIRFLLECRRLFEKYSKDEMSVYAAQASFFIILASIPFLMLLLSLIQATPLVNESDLLSLVVQMVPDTLDGLWSMYWTVSIRLSHGPFCQPRPLQPSGPPPGEC